MKLPKKELLIDYVIINDVKLPKKEIWVNNNNNKYRIIKKEI